MQYPGLKDLRTVSRWWRQRLGGVLEGMANVLGGDFISPVLHKNYSKPRTP
jgi:hypothetical protein